MNDTRDRILEVALDLFIEQGYDKTSLREIAERVGVTKAALYYHFASKEEIFRTLIEPILTITEPLAELLQGRPTRESWARGWSTFLEWILPRRKLIELMQNNHGALHALGPAFQQDEAHQAMHERLQAILSDEALPLDDRVRMAGAIGLVVGVLAFPGESAFGHVSAEELQPLLLDAIKDVLQVS